MLVSCAARLPPWKPVGSVGSNDTRLCFTCRGPRLPDDVPLPVCAKHHANDFHIGSMESEAPSLFYFLPEIFCIVNILSAFVGIVCLSVRRRNAISKKRRSFRIVLADMLMCHGLPVVSAIMIGNSLSFEDLAARIDHTSNGGGGAEQAAADYNSAMFRLTGSTNPHQAWMQPKSWLLLLCAAHSALHVALLWMQRISVWLGLAPIQQYAQAIAERAAGRASLDSSHSCSRPAAQHALRQIVRNSAEAVAAESVGI